MQINLDHARDMQRASCVMTMAGRGKTGGNEKEGNESIKGALSSEYVGLIIIGGRAGTA